MRWVVLWETLLVLGSLGLGAMVLFPAWRLPIEFFLLSIASTTLLPIPHEPILLHYAFRIQNPWIVGIASGLGACVAAAIDYQAFQQVWELPPLSPVKRSRLFTWAVRWFQVQPFLATWIFFLLPLPDHLVRALAPAAQFPRTQYIAAVGLGRAPRGFALALLGQSIEFPWWSLALIGIAIVLAAILPIIGRNRRWKT